MSEIPRTCQQRQHAYPSQELGAVCVLCGKVRGTRINGLGPRRIIGDRAQEFALALGADAPVVDPTAPAAPAQPVAPGETLPPAARKPVTTVARVAAPPVEPNETHTWLSQRLTMIILGGVEWANEKRGRKANDPDPRDQAQFERSFAQQLAIMMPNSQGGPKTMMAISGLFMVVEMSRNAPLLEKPQAKINPVLTNGANGAAPILRSVGGTAPNADAKPAPPAPTGDTGLGDFLRSYPKIEPPA